MSLSERTARERELHNVGLKRKTLDHVLRHLALGPSAQRRMALLHNIMAEQTGKRVLEIGSQAWDVWMTRAGAFPRNYIA